MDTFKVAAEGDGWCSLYSCLHPTTASSCSTASSCHCSDASVVQVWQSMSSHRRLRVLEDWQPQQGLRVVVAPDCVDKVVTRICYAWQ
jgi:hypothetical protein